MNDYAILSIMIKGFFKKNFRDKLFKTIIPLNILMAKKVFNKRIHRIRRKLERRKLKEITKETVKKKLEKKLAKKAAMPSKEE